MNQFYIIEIQQYANGEFGHIIHFAFDENPIKARFKAESKYHEVLASAAISELPQHSATLLTCDGRAIMNQCYKHEIVTPEPEYEEPIPEEDGSEETESIGE